MGREEAVFADIFSFKYFLFLLHHFARSERNKQNFISPREVCRNWLPRDSKLLSFVCFFRSVQDSAIFAYQLMAPRSCASETKVCLSSLMKNSFLCPRLRDIHKALQSRDMGWSEKLFVIVGLAYKRLLIANRIVYLHAYFVTVFLFTLFASSRSPSCATH